MQGGSGSSSRPQIDPARGSSSRQSNSASGPSSTVYSSSGKEKAVSRPRDALNESRPSNKPHNEELERVWSELEKGVGPILENTRFGLSRPMYMRLYTLVINYCTEYQPSVEAKAGTHFRGGDLYEKLRSYLRLYLKNLANDSKALSETDLLQMYASKWQNYTVSCRLCHNIFSYINRNWVKQQQSESRVPYKPPFIYDMGLVQWRELYFSAVQPRLTSGVLRIVEAQRNGEMTDSTLLQTILASYVDLNIPDVGAGRANIKTHLSVYCDYFEEPFLRATKEYYTAEGEAFLSNHSMYAYLVKVEQRLAEETDRCKKFMHPVTQSSLLEACCLVLLVHLMPRIKLEIPQFFSEKRLEDLARLYRLMQHVEGGVDLLVKALHDHVVNEGLAAVKNLLESSKIATAGISNSKNAANDDDDDAEMENNDDGGKPKRKPVGAIVPKDYVDTIFSVYDKYRHLIADGFGNDMVMVKALHAACKVFINHNVLSEKNSVASGKTIALYADSVLKKSSKVGTEQLIEATIEDIMTMYRFLEAPDAFEEWYQKTLSKRLLYNQSIGEEVEELLLSKIRDHRGANETAKYHKMLQDMAISHDLTENFKSSPMGQDVATDIDVKVCSAGVWPLSKPDPKNVANASFLVPPEIAKMSDQFHNFYMQKHSGRVLHWMWSHSRADLKVNYPATKSGGKTSTYIFSVTAHQMALLLQFNESSELCVEDLMVATGLPAQAVIGAATWLLKGRVLKILHPKDTNVSKLEQDTRLALNMDFKNKKMRLNFAKMNKEESIAEDRDVLEKIQEGRRMMTQAAMVRIMKARKSVQYNQLVSEAISLIKGRFLPQVSEVKKCIDILMEKEFIRRDESDRNLLHYIA